MKKSGRIIQHEDGRKGLAYNSEQTIKGKFLIHLLDEKMKPVEGNLMWPHGKCKVIGFID